jgi:hypothetical protein
MTRDDQWRRAFTREVTEVVIAQASPAVAPCDTLPDAYDRLHEALQRFCTKIERQPEFFTDVSHGVGWVFATYRNLGRWADDDPLVSLDAFPAEPEVRAIWRSAPAATAASNVAASDPTDVICSYFTDEGGAPGGRLGISREAIAVVQLMGEFGLARAGERVPTAVWESIGGALGLTHDAAQDLYQQARLAFAVVFYVIGALGPPDSLSSTAHLARAVTTFRKRFTGQRAWSILKFAAGAAVPKGGYAQVDQALFRRAILTRARQAAKCGLGPGTADPVRVLDGIEHRAAEALGQPFPRCVFAADGVPHRPDPTRPTDPAPTAQGEYRP